MIKKLSFFLSVLVLSSVFGYFIFAWTEPGTAPPGGNVPVPINVGPSTQTKTGGLNLDGNLNLQGNKLIISSGDGEIYRSGGQITYQADDNWYWYSSWDGHNEMTLHYRNGLWLRSDVEADDLKARNRVCIQGDCRSFWPSETNLSGWSFANDYLYDDGEEVIRANDEWLRLNQSGHFTSGVYTPGKIRADGGLYVGDDERIYRCGEDYVCTDDNFMVIGGGWLRVDGSEGLYFQSYGGGWRMTDSTWIRSYGGKRVYVDSIVRADGGFQVDGTTVIGGDAWIEGDRIRQNTIDGSKIQDNTLTAADLAANSCGNSELIDNPTFNNVNVNGTLRIQYTRADRTCNNRYCKATCSSGWRVIGGGCESSGGVVIDNRPEYRWRSDWDRSWVCYGGGGVVIETAYAICLKIQQP